MNFLKYLFIGGVLMMISQDTYAQNKIELTPNPLTIGKPRKLFSPFSDTLKNKIKLKEFRLYDDLGIMHVPDIVAINVPDPVYQFNNHQGFDVYQSPFDGMPIIMPDKSFSSNMPVVGNLKESEAK
jgi:hypothetical protein